MILDCCAELIPSSKANRNIVQRASTAIPATTSQNATLWMDEEYLGPSRIIPAPTAQLASTLIANNQTCGQNGSTPPERNPLTYVTIPAILGWLIASIMAMIKLAKSVMSLGKKERK